MEMKLLFCESDINDLANGYTEYQRVSNREREPRVIRLRDDIQQALAGIYCVLSGHCEPNREIHALRPHRPTPEAERGFDAPVP